MRGHRVPATLWAVVTHAEILAAKRDWGTFSDGAAGPIPNKRQNWLPQISFGHCVTRDVELGG